MTLKDTENRIQRKSYFLPEFNTTVNSEFNDPQAIRQDFMVSNLNRSKTQFVGLEDVGTTTEDDFRNRIVTGLKGVGQSVLQPIFQTARGIEAFTRYETDLGKRNKARTALAEAYSKGEIKDEEYLNSLFEYNTQEYEKIRQKSLAEVKLTSVAHNNFLKAAGLEIDERDKPAWATGGQVVGSVMQSMIGGVFLKAPAAVSILWGLSQANQSWEEALENGKSRTRAAGLGVTNGTLNAAIEMIGAERILSAFKANIPLTKILVSALGEGGEELGQGLVDETLMQKLGGRKKEFGETVKDLFASFLIGGFAGGGMAAGHIAFGKLVDMSDKKTAAKIAERLQNAASSAPAQAEAEKLIWRQEHPVNFKENSANATIEETKALMAKQNRKAQIDAITTEKEAMLKDMGLTDEEARAGGVLAANSINNIAISKGITPELANSYLNLKIQRDADIANGIEAAPAEDNSFDTVEFNQAAAEINNTEIINKAKKFYGTTKNLNETGYILPNGELLDFSGKKEGGQAGVRNIDHREINDVFSLTNGNDAMEQFISAGNIRFSPESNSFDLIIEPTPAQKKILKNIIEQNNGEVIIEISNKDTYGRRGSRQNFYEEYEAGTPSDKIFNDIDTYFKGENRYKSNVTIYHQSAAEDVFKAQKEEADQYRNYVDNLFKKGLKPSMAIATIGKTPEIYTNFNLPQKPLGIPVNIIKKAVVDKHSLTEDNIKHLPEMIADPLLILKSATQQDSLVAVIDDTDKNGDTIIVILKPTTGKINVIPSAYGKEKLSNFIKKEIKAGRLLYLDEKKASARLSGVQFPARGKGSLNSVQTKEAVVKTYNQDKRGAINLSKKGGVYEALVKIMKQSDKTTIMHELGHLWLYTAQDIYSKEEFDDVRKDLDEWIGKPKVKDGRYVYTKAQQEKLAKGLETYLGEGKAPTPALQGVFDKFREWFMQTYNGALVEMSDAGRAVYARMFQLEGQAADESLTLYQDAAKNKKVREGIEQLRKDGKMNVEGLTMQDIENYLQILDMGAPPLPKATLLTYLKKYGADYGNAAKIDKEEYLNAKIPNRPTGINDGLARQLISWGFLDGKIENYEDLSRMDDEAAELIHRALQGENVYRLEDMQDVDRFEQYKEAVAMAEDALGGRIEEYRRIVDIIKGLKIEGYRPVSAADIEFVADKLEELSNITQDETAKVLSTQIESAKKQAAEWKEAAERRLAALGSVSAKAEEDAQYAAQKAELKTQEKYFDEVLQKNKQQAQRIKRSITEEINKRELEGKEAMLKELNAAQTPQEIFAAADKLIEELQKEYDKTPEGQSEKKKLDVPSTDWEAKKLMLLKELNNLSQNIDEKTRKALDWIRQDNLATVKQRAVLSAEEKAQVSEAKRFLKEDYTPQIMSILGKSLQDEEHFYPKDRAAILSRYASTITNFEKIQKYSVDSFISFAKRLQQENYNRYIWHKLNTLLNRKQFEKIGKVKKAKYSATAMQFLKEAADVWDLPVTDAQTKLEAQKLKSFNDFEKGEMTDIKDILLNRVLEFKINGKDNNPEASRRTFDEVEALLKSGRRDVRNENEGKRLNRELMTEAVNQAIRRRKYPMGAKWFLKLADTNFKEFITNALGTFHYEGIDADGNRINKKIDFSKEFDMLTGQRGTKLYTYKKHNEINEIFKRTMGIESNNGILNKIAEMQQIVYKAENFMRRINAMEGNQMAAFILNNKWVDPNPIRIENLNKLKIMSIYEWYKNSLIDPETGNDNGLRGRLLRQYGEKQIKEMFALLSEEEKALADGLQKFVAAQWAAENAVFSELHGFSLPNDPDYLPSVARRMDIGGDIDYMREYAKNSIHPSFSMERTKSPRVEMKPISILTIVENHTARAGEYINEAIPFTEIKGILKNNKIADAFEAVFGEEEGIAVYNKLLRVIDLQAPQKPKPLALLSRTADAAFNGWVKAAMALKLTIGVKQMATGIAFTEKMPVDKYFKYWAEGLASPKKTYDFMSKNVPDIGVRFAQGGINESISRAMASRDIALYSTQWNSFTNLMLLNIRLGDAGSFIYGGYPYYKYLTEDLKMSPAQARIAFMEQGESTLQSSHKALLGEWQANQSNYVTRVFTVFRNQPKQYFGKVVTSYIQYKNGEISAQDFGKKWMLYIVVNPMIYELLGLAWIFSDDDDDEKEKKGIFSVLSSPLTGLASVNAFSDAAVRYLLDAAYAKTQGKKLPAPQSIRIPAFDDIKSDVQKAVAAYNKAGSIEDLLSEMTVSDYADFLAALLKYTGLPAPTMLNIGGGVADIAEGNIAKGALRVAGYTDYRAGKVTGQEKEKRKRRKNKTY